MELTELRCKSCGATLNPDSIVLRLAMARCDHCGAVFALKGFPSPDGSAKAENRKRLKVPMPKGIRVQEFGNLLEIRWRWYSHALIALAGFCLFWNGFMVAWHTMALSMGAWFMSLFGLIHTAVGIGVAYFTVAGFLNTTVIRVRRGVMEIKSGPVPWGGNKTLLADDIEQLYCKEQIRHGKNSTRCSYQIHAVTKGNVKRTLLKGLTEADQALYIEQELERFLGIEDRPTRGEIPR